MKLVIVESPTKAKTISRFLPDDFMVDSSYGHIRDLPKGELGVDVEHDFEPKYVIPTSSRKTVTTLKKEAAKADNIILATDGDREGEAIAWHIAEALGLTDSKISRIVFHEITKPAILEALKNPRAIDMNLVDAQQARRVLDRLVGYKLSPLLWKKVMRGLSAGRVQSVALRLIVEREREREKFVPQEYWTVEAELKKESGELFKAKLWKDGDKILKDLDLKNKSEVDEILAGLEKATWSVTDVSVKETRRNPLAPFTTSTLQQEASRRLHFSAKQTMRLAQQLYEGVDLGEGREGLITYMRTDSVNLSGSSRQAAEIFIKKNYGGDYANTRSFKTKSKLAQEAHEAVRPTDPNRTPESVKDYLDSRQFKLYDLIWRRFVASQMSTAVFDSTAAVIETKTPYVFRASGLVQKFDGFLKVWPQKTTETILPPLVVQEKLSLEKILPERHETQPPARYSEATLVKTLEEYGIGRPSTYAPTMSTIQERGYIKKDENRKFFPAEIGMVVNDLLVEHFPNIVDINFTAGMEEDLDKIAEGKKEWVPMMREFWEPFSATLQQKTAELKKSDFKKDEPTDKVCPKCGKPLVIKLGRFGRFYACTGFPECKYTENLVEKIDMACPECGQGEVIVKRTRRGKTFYGCSRYPDCKYASWKNPKEKGEDKE